MQLPYNSRHCEIVKLAVVGKWLLKRGYIYRKFCTLEYQKMVIFKEVGVVERKPFVEMSV